jgi:hypothetical protein
MGTILKVVLAGAAVGALGALAIFGLKKYLPSVGNKIPSA